MRDAGWPEREEAGELCDGIRPLAAEPDNRFNPGTTADLVTAALYAALREGAHIDQIMASSARKSEIGGEAGTDGVWVGWQGEGMGRPGGQRVRSRFACGPLRSPLPACDPGGPIGGSIDALFLHGLLLPAGVMPAIRLLPRIWAPIRLRPRSGADAHVRLASWCETHGMQVERHKHLGIALEIAPDHPADSWPARTGRR